MLVLIEIWTILTSGEQWISNLHSVTLYGKGPFTVSPSTPTVEPEDFLPLAGIILILGLGLVGVRATWRSRPLPVLAVGLALAVITILGSWTIGLLFAPPALLVLIAAAALVLSGKSATAG